MKQTRVRSPPGKAFSSINPLIVKVACCKYPESKAGWLTSNKKTKVGGMGGLFMYSLDAMKSTVP